MIKVFKNKNNDGYWFKSKTNDGDCARIYIKYYKKIVILKKIIFSSEDLTDKYYAKIYTRFNKILWYKEISFKDESFELMADLTIKKPI